MQMGMPVANHRPHCSWCHRLLNAPYEDYKGDLVDIPEAEQDREVLFMSNVFVGSPVERTLKPITWALCPECQKEFGLEKLSLFLKKLTEESRKILERYKPEDRLGVASRLIKPGDARAKLAVGEREFPGAGLTSD